MTTQNMVIALAIVFIALASYVVIFQKPVTSETPRNDVSISGGSNENGMPANQDAMPSSGASGKIDIDAVCNGALAYMTFSDGAAAELFVKECKEGKHPEVIERFRADMGLGADVAI